MEGNSNVKNGGLGEKRYGSFTNAHIPLTKAGNSSIFRVVAVVHS